tara:strand:- start:1101 stop:2240 length:1140 start_codon:yes stop_codon:yes gene_type:complete
MSVAQLTAVRQKKANEAVRVLGDILRAEPHDLVRLGGGKSTHENRVEHLKAFLKVLTPEKCTQVFNELQAKVERVLMTNEPHQRGYKLEVKHLTALTKVLETEGGLSPATPKGIPKCLRALGYMQRNGHSVEAAIKQMEEEMEKGMEPKKKKAKPSANGGNGAAATDTAMDIDKTGVDENAGKACDAGTTQTSELVLAQEALPFAEPGNVPAFAGFGEPGNVAVFAGEKDAAKKDDDKRKSLQAEKEKLEAQLVNKKSPAATPASNGSNAGEPDKSPAFSGDKWHADVKAQLTSLEKKGKLKEAELDEGALKELKTLPYVVALVCLTKVMNETNAIRNINAFIIKNCKHLRDQWGIDDAASSSSDDDSSDDESESEEEA